MIHPSFHLVLVYCYNKQERRRQETCSLCSLATIGSQSSKAGLVIGQLAGGERTELCSRGKSVFCVVLLKEAFGLPFSQDLKPRKRQALVTPQNQKGPRIHFRIFLYQIRQESPPFLASASVFLFFCFDTASTKEDKSQLLPFWHTTDYPNTSSLE